MRITSEAISQEEVTKFVTDPSAGGVSIFLGTHSILIVAHINHDCRVHLYRYDFLVPPSLLRKFIDFFLYIIIYAYIGMTRDHFQG